MPPTRATSMLMLNSGNVTWTNMPTAATELFGNVHRRAKVHLVDVDQVRLVARVSTAGATNAVIRAQYSTDESAWNTLTTDLGINGTASTRASAWQACPAGAKGEVFVRVMGQSGDGAFDPVLGNIYLEYR